MAGTPAPEVGRSSQERVQAEAEGTLLASEPPVLVRLTAATPLLHVRGVFETRHLPLDTLTIWVKDTSLSFGPRATP